MLFVKLLISPILYASSVSGYLIGLRPSKSQRVKRYYKTNQNFLIFLNHKPSFQTSIDKTVSTVLERTQGLTAAFQIHLDTSVQPPPSSPAPLPSAV